MSDARGQLLKFLTLKNYICISQCRENHMESTKVQRWCWLVLGDLQPVCHAVPVGVGQPKRGQSQGWFDFWSSVPDFFVIFFASLESVLHLFFCMYKHTNILMARPSCGGQRTTFMSLFSIFFM